MSTQLFDHNPDLKKLKDEGYNISIINGHIVIQGVPYLNSDKKVFFDSIYCPFTQEGFKIRQNDHTVFFTGEYPCDQLGNELSSIVNDHRQDILREDIIGKFYLSSKPESGSYSDFYAKMQRYVDLLSAPAKSVDPSVDAKNFDYISYMETSVFCYPDTNSARSGINNINNKVKDQKIAIIGLGGTGAFILDYISKTPVSEIVLFDGDQLKNHNAFRIPGAVPLDELNKHQSKVSYLKRKYENLRKDSINFCEEFIDETNVDVLHDYDFVFIAIDDSKARGIIVHFLMESKIPFIDVGMGITKLENSLRGQIRRTMITPDNIEELNKIPIQEEEGDAEDIYQENIQLIELNALNAALAVIAWKKYFGFYNNLDMVYDSVFVIDQEVISNGS